MHYAFRLSVVSFIIRVSLALAGIFGPLFTAQAVEDSTKNISGDRSPDFSRHRVLSPEKTHPPDGIVNDTPKTRLSCGNFSRFYEQGVASWYGPGFHGRQMANNKTYDMDAYTVAHRFLPLGTRICILNPKNGRFVRATVTDRGPHIDDRVVDLSRRIADELDTIKSGLARVHIFLRS